MDVGDKPRSGGDDCGECRDGGHDSMRDVIEVYKKDLDYSLIASRLAMSVDERFLTLMQMQRDIQALREAGAAAGRAKDLEAIAELEALRDRAAR